MVQRSIVLLTAIALLAGTRPPDIPFEHRMLDIGASEAAAIADLNGDRRLDIVSGENYYLAPAFKAQRFRDVNFTNNYVDDFSDLVFDVDGEGAADVVSCSWFSRELAWWKNPGKASGAWKRELIEGGANSEFCFLVDLDNDGKAREILPQFGNAKLPLAWYEYSGGKWNKHVVSERSHGHGIGAGDVNGDGKTDVLVPTGWFEAGAAGAWTWHPDFEPLQIKSPGFMHVLDVNGDQRNDVVFGLAHDYGLIYLENQGNGQWKRNVIDDSWSQPHAVTIADLNLDGQPDLLTGKRYMAHNGRDPGEREPLGIYWYEYRRTPGKPGEPTKVEWVRHVIDYAGRAGGGMQLPVADIDGDGDLDFAAPGKSGLFLFLNKTKP